MPNTDGNLAALAQYQAEVDAQDGPTPLIAAMRAFVVFKRGPRVTIPARLKHHVAPKQ